MSKVSVFKKKGGIIRVQNYVADFGDIDALQNVGRQKSRVINRGALITKVVQGELQSFDPDSDLVLLDSVLPDAIAVSLSWNLGDALLPAEEVFLWADSITALRYDIADVLTGVNATEAVLEDQIAEFDNM
jgi:hypothetical protein